MKIKNIIELLSIIIALFFCASTIEAMEQHQPKINLDNKEISPLLINSAQEYINNHPDKKINYSSLMRLIDSVFTDCKENEKLLYEEFTKYHQLDKSGDLVNEEISAVVSEYLPEMLPNICTYNFILSLYVIPYIKKAKENFTSFKGEDVSSMSWDGAFAYLHRLVASLFYYESILKDIISHEKKNVILKDGTDVIDLIGGQGSNYIYLPYMSVDSSLIDYYSVLEFISSMQNSNEYNFDIYKDSFLEKYVRHRGNLISTNQLKSNEQLADTTQLMSVVSMTFSLIFRHRVTAEQSNKIYHEYKYNRNKYKNEIMDSFRSGVLPKEIVSDFNPRQLVYKSADEIYDPPIDFSDKKRALPIYKDFILLLEKVFARKQAVVDTYLSVNINKPHVKEMLNAKGVDDKVKKFLKEVHEKVKNNEDNTVKESPVVESFDIVRHVYGKPKQSDAALCKIANVMYEGRKNQNKRKSYRKKLADFIDKNENIYDYFMNSRNGSKQIKSARNLLKLFRFHGYKDLPSIEKFDNFCKKSLKQPKNSAAVEEPIVIDDAINKPKNHSNRTPKIGPDNNRQLGKTIAQIMEEKPKRKKRRKRRRKRANNKTQETRDNYNVKTVKIGGKNFKLLQRNEGNNIDTPQEQACLAERDIIGVDFTNTCEKIKNHVSLYRSIHSNYKNRVGIASNQYITLEKRIAYRNFLINYNQNIRNSIDHICKIWVDLLKKSEGCFFNYFQTYNYFKEHNSLEHQHDNTKGPCMMDYVKLLKQYKNYSKTNDNEYILFKVWIQVVNKYSNMFMFNMNNSSPVSKGQEDEDIEKIESDISELEDLNITLLDKYNNYERNFHADLSNMFNCLLSYLGFIDSVYDLAKKPAEILTSYEEDPILEEIFKVAEYYSEEKEHFKIFKLSIDEIFESMVIYNGMVKSIN